ncbi:MAG: 4-hydroxy-3-methylbut-2-enyl diphosphate reductase [Microgenomates group bacterium Gr01-1014_93]|nr:MAG: 4-hydroxy-3-methylbut-2-enyl diphosphate reductase [Microgenomates group bacterium Gr01-1014_93]
MLKLSNMVKSSNMMETLPEKVLVASPRAFCAGVERAIRMTDELRSKVSGPIYVYHEIIHNKPVVVEFRAKEVVFVDDIEDIPDDSNAEFSAHGVTNKVRQRAKEKGLHWLDATCPLVRKVHDERDRFIAEGRQIILFGHKGHDETVGTVNDNPENIKLVTSISDLDSLEVRNPEKLALLTQTTLSVDDTKEVADAIRRRFPNIVEPKKEDICFATQNRQNGVKEMVKLWAEVILILGSQNSSNSQRLKEVAQSFGVKGYLFDDVYEFDLDWILGKRIIGITAGASAAPERVDGLTAHLKNLGISNFEEVVVAREGFNFK